MLANTNIPFLWGPPLTAEQASRILYLIAFPVAVIFLGKYTKPAIKLNNDISYGVYIYGWPIAQTIAYVFIGQGRALNPPLFFAVTMLLTAPLAFISWKAIEKPALSLKNRLLWKT